MKQKNKDYYRKPLNKARKIDLLLAINYMNDGKILMAKDFYFQMMLHYPEQSKDFASPVEVGKLLEQTSVESVKQGKTIPKIYLCSTDAQRIYY